jgi:NADH pyrophosphatase NudC (nudix superfamily)
MTTEFDVHSPGSESMDNDVTMQVCGACGHTGLSHDAIAKRFCQASRDRALDRVCVCRILVSLDEMVSEHAGSTVRRSETPMYGRGRLSRT